MAKGDKGKGKGKKGKSKGTNGKKGVYGVDGYWDAREIEETHLRGPKISGRTTVSRMRVRSMIRTRCWTTSVAESIPVVLGPA